jgi:hypothetical protein
LAADQSSFYARIRFKTATSGIGSRSTSTCARSPKAQERAAQSSGRRTHFGKYTLASLNARLKRKVEALDPAWRLEIALEADGLD